VQRGDSSEHSRHHQSTTAGVLYSRPYRMADPLSVAGLAVGVASLAFELFSGCVKGMLALVPSESRPPCLPCNRL